MKLRFHEWMTRSLNKAKFTPAEHLLYVGLALALGAGLLGSFWLAFRWPSPASFGLLVLAVAGAWWVMLQTPRYDADGKLQQQTLPR
jgi:hypothetical protein